jgi:REP element-mobilizing transposase RayT
MKAKQGQLELPMPAPVYKGRGGRRPGAGRKKLEHPRGLPHRRRPYHQYDVPVHITWRVQSYLPSLRGFYLAGAIGSAIRAAMEDHERRRTSFRVIHFSIQPDHLHLMIEARNKTVLGNGMRALGVRIARAINRVLRRTGRVFHDRYHLSPLRCPTQVRIGIVYVLQNHKHHDPADTDVDPLSSARWFTGWEAPLRPPSTPPPVRRPRTWMARAGWRQVGGPIRFSEEPAS